MQERLNDLKKTDPKTFLQWLWYCREVLHLDPNVVPVYYLDSWLNLPINRREMGY